MDLHINTHQHGSMCITVDVISKPIAGISALRRLMLKTVSLESESGVPDPLRGGSNQKSDEAGRLKGLHTPLSTSDAPRCSMVTNTWSPQKCLQVKKKNLP